VQVRECIGRVRRGLCADVSLGAFVLLAQVGMANYAYMIAHWQGRGPQVTVGVGCVFCDSLRVKHLSQLKPGPCAFSILLLCTDSDLFHFHLPVGIVFIGSAPNSHTIPAPLFVILLLSEATRYPQQFSTEPNNTHTKSPQPHPQKEGSPEPPKGSPKCTFNLSRSRVQPEKVTENSE